MTPAAVEERYGVPPEALSRAGRDRRRDLRQPARCARRRARVRRQVDQPVRRPRQRRRPRRRDHRQEGRGAARAPRRRDAQPPAQRAGLRPRPAADPDRPGGAARGTAQEVHTLFDGLEFRVLRDRLFETLSPRRSIDDSGFALDMAGSRRARSATGWPTHAGPTGSGSAYTWRARWGSGTGDVRRSRSPPPTAGRPGRRRAEITPGGRRGDRVLVRRPRPAEGAARRQGADAGAGRPRLAAASGWIATPRLSAYLARPDQRSYDLADLTVRYLKRELKQGGDRRRPAQPRRARRRRRRSETAMLHASAVLDLAAALDDELDEPRRHRPARRRRAAADRRAGPDGAGRHRRRPRPARASSRRVRRPGARRGRGGLRRDRQGDQPRVAQAAPGGALRGARDAEDQAHQDRLHHRRRRAAGALREDRAPVPASTCSSTATRSGCGRPWRDCSRPWPRTAASTPPSTS